MTRLQELPDTYQRTRDALHQVAFYAVAPARYAAVGRMGLRATPGGFGTPEFGNRRQITVREDLLIDRKADVSASQKITTVREAARFLGLEYTVDWFDDFHDPLAPVDPDTHLDIDPAASSALGAWFEFGFDVLNRLRRQGKEDDEVSEAQLWPEHFDAATELGSQERGQRASYGASPGDAAHPEPYLYVAAWADIDRSNPYWNDTSFNGASLGYAELLTSADPTTAALGFYLEGYQILHQA